MQFHFFSNVTVIYAIKKTPEKIFGLKEDEQTIKQNVFLRVKARFFHEKSILQNVMW